MKRGQFKDTRRRDKESVPERESVREREREKD